MTALARLSLANRSLVMMIALVLSAFGVFAIPSLKQQLLPSLSFPGAFVIAPYPGASPEIVEERVTEPIENGFQGLAGVTEVTSTSREGMSQVQVAFEYGTDIDAAVADMQQAVSRIASRLPEGVDPQVLSGGTDDIPVMVLAVGDGGDERAMADRLERLVVPELQGIAGVREAAVTGTRDEVVTITPDVKELARRGLAPTAVADALRANGQPVPAGSLTEGGKSLTVQVGRRISTLKELEDLYLLPAAAPAAPAAPAGPAGVGRGQQQAPGGVGRPAQAVPGPVRLGEVAKVERSLAEGTSLTRTNGKPSLGVSVTMAPDGNAVAISHAVREKIPGLVRAIGDAAAVTVVFDQAPYVERSIEDLTTEGLLGLTFAVLVILVFLLSLRSTLVTAVSIPLSVVIALMALWLGDYSLNLLTLGALTIAVGRVVDDSIVVLENIKRHLEYGEAKRAAVLAGVREVSGAVTASTLTTVAVFLPIAVVGGMVGQLFAPFAVTVTVALLASLLVSLTVVPVLAYWFLRAPAVSAERARVIREEAEAKELRSPLQRAYLPVLRFATRRRLVTLLVGAVVFAATMGLAGRLETNFLDASGQDTISISQRMPAGTDLATTDAAAGKVEEVLGAFKDAGDVQDYQVTVGGGGTGLLGAAGGGGDRASYSVTAGAEADSAAVEERLRERLKAVSGAGEITVGGGGGGFGGGPANQLEVVVRAPDIATLRSAAETVRASMAGVGGLRDVRSNLEAGAERVEVRVDRKKAAARGLTEAQIGQAVAQRFRGAPLGQLTLDGVSGDVVLRTSEAPQEVEAVGDLELVSAAGPVKLSKVAKVVTVEGPVQITRIDGERSATVTGTATASDLGAVTAELTSKLEGLKLPAGAGYVVGGVSADQEEAFGQLGLAMLAAIAIVFMIMVAAFGSFVQPLILLVSVPFAATGAIGLLLVTGTPLGVPALIGMLMLIGIVVTNAIVLIDLINQYREQGMGIVEAVVEGGRRRLRPILMTAVATIFALVPMALGLTGSGGFISQPLAIVVIGGLLSSTLLTLVLVPTLYVMVERAKERLRRSPGGGAGSGAETQDAGEPVAAR
ncbi:HAE1 family hydrophobic/amphiphilic exporter-1 [Streptosporangium becharense]|uniref:HAE1 family hydrophobic/amphiphilic exporter-1 n=1 Tax=Streptosporangium becharense TaxID=1816182 RepID=A0A7W9IMP0_9ACTN|nr:efflux RND transporter permease subunit [Streptosporangium becharense]MBB2914401.1 HAE1 family hydrophobic/amphiphilic exporter-1 [Streptosporangium becharense]MBB5823567.1 HAE1 family hydrophobic/amphiphilic exporter-1 [Streptosporangium becharense]